MELGYGASMVFVLITTLESKGTLDKIVNIFIIRQFFQVFKNLLIKRLKILWINITMYHFLQ